MPSESLPLPLAIVEDGVIAFLKAGIPLRLLMDLADTDLCSEELYGLEGSG